MSLTGLQMRTASSPVISKAQSKPRLHQGKTPQHKNTGFLGLFCSLVPYIICYTVGCKANRSWAGNCWGIEKKKVITVWLKLRKHCRCVAEQFFFYIHFFICKCINVMFWRIFLSPTYIIMYIYSMIITFNVHTSNTVCVHVFALPCASSEESRFLFFPPPLAWPLSVILCRIIFLFLWEHYAVFYPS